MTRSVATILKLYKENPSQLTRAELLFVRVELKRLEKKQGGAAGEDAYEKIKREAAKRRRDASAAGRDIGPVPDIADVARREACRNDLAAFCRVYNPAAFRLPWCEYHFRAIRRIEEAATKGALYAFAFPRGRGKSTIARHASLWAVAYGWCRYVFMIGSNQDKADEALDGVKKVIRFLPLFAADFPEIAHAFVALKGISNKAAGQTCGGESTLIEWGKGQITLPTVPPPANWPPGWPLRADGMVPTSGSIISASGLTGEGLRGSVVTLATGEFLRPDLILLDDPQTADSAKSPSQCADRERLIAADLLGMAGPDKPISAVMPCTVIYPGDAADHLLDRALYPLWRGERAGLLKSMPADLTAWEQYRQVWAACAAKEPSDYDEANAYYLAHRAQLDAGAEASWAESKYDNEVSAIQHAMHRYLRSARAFWSEDMNCPLPLEEPSPDELKHDEITARLNHHARGLVPAWAQRLTAFIDVQHHLLWYAVCGWSEDFTGCVLDYGAWPDQRRPYFTKADARPTLAAATGVGSLEGSVWAGLEALTGQLLGRDWVAEGGALLRVERCLVDFGEGQLSDLVKKFCRESRHAAVLLPSKGMGLTAARNPIDEWRKKPGERRGHNWIIPVPERGRGRYLLFDANLCKSFLAGRLRQPLGEPGALTLFGSDADAHRMLADHFCSEYTVQTSRKASKSTTGREVQEWMERPNRPDNDLWDCCVGAAVAAAERGCALKEMRQAARAAGGQRRTLAEMQADARRRREGR